jgi:hypothetical protein
MKRIKSIEMATNDLLLGVTLGEPMTIVDSRNGYFEVHEGDEVVYNTAASVSMAEIWAKEYAIDDGQLLTSGYGTNSGRKFWQLPESIQDEALKLAGFVEADV